MLILNGPLLSRNINDPDIRAVVEQRFTQILSGEPYDYVLHGYMIVVEPHDSIEFLEEETQCPILHNYFDDTRFGDPDFTPCFEALEEHDKCFEMVFILNDGGFGITIFIPKQSGINADLLVMCAEYAVPATALSQL
ncbi:hypothetical protein [Nitrosomonas sp.]|uniref:hypothetical protein n=1 Tax=Nitrosomonas sp. TaxID=42353 RepID=UPI0025F932A0|nr:hypothetical protein [Nitrosomonas sp.]